MDERQRKYLATGKELGAIVLTADLPSLSLERFHESYSRKGALLFVILNEVKNPVDNS
jgi:hypothetical protein